MTVGDYIATVILVWVWCVLMYKAILLVDARVYKSRSKLIEKNKPVKKDKPVKLEIPPPNYLDDVNVFVLYPDRDEVDVKIDHWFDRAVKNVEEKTD